MAAIRVVLLLVLVSIACAAPRKRLAGSPEEFALHQIPNPKNVKLVERSVTEYVRLQKDPSTGILSAKLTIPVDGPNEFVWSIASPLEDKLSLQMLDPTGERVDLNAARVESPFSLGVGNEVPVTVYVVLDSMEGYYELDITAESLTEAEEARALDENNFAPILVTLINNDDVVIRSHLTSYEISIGKPISVQAEIGTTRNGEFVRTEEIGVSSAVLDVVGPKGSETLVPMNDDGVDGDLVANDGIWGGQLIASTPGQYIATPLLKGYYTSTKDSDRVQFVRSTQHLVGVSQARLQITGKGKVVKKDSQRLDIVLGVTDSSAQSVDIVRAFAEVWGKTAQGELVPAAWVGGLVDLANNALGLELNAQWLTRAKIVGDLILRNTYLADPSTSFPIAVHADDIPLPAHSDVLELLGLAQLEGKVSDEITREMKEGVNPLLKGDRPLGAEATKGLIMVPGYCSGENPWKRNQQDFTDAFYFNEHNLNLSNDDYAKRVMAFAETTGLQSFGMIGHSQGGIVSLHIHNYYFTGLEGATGGRLIQSVGTPWEGCTAAGSAADLGGSFGVGCGSNSDLAPDGAVNWLAGIQTDSRKDVYFFTTTYKQGNFFGDYCAMSMNMVLEWPNDGVTELTYAKLTGGNNMGNTEKWCHTTDMAYPAQYDDNNRNANMNAGASR